MPAFSQGLIEVSIDRRFELMSIVFRLAEFSEYRMGNVADYNAAVDGYFGPFKDHAVVRQARELRPKVAFDAIPNLAVRVSDAVTFKPLRPLEDPATHLDSRWDPDAAAAFLKAMASFAADTRADRFFADLQPLYRASINSCRRDLLSHLDQAWFERTLGKRDRDTFTLCIALLNGPGNYGASVPNDKGGEDLFALIGTTEAPERFAEWQRARQERLDAMSAKGPKLVSMDPADGATDVDPSLTVIRFTFDRPMKSGMSLMRVDGTFPESADKPSWDEEGRVLSFPVRLKPATTYRFGLNAEDYYGFQDRGGSPLRPVVVTFRTR